MENDRECLQEHAEFLHAYTKYARVIFRKIKEKDGSDKLIVEYKSEIAELSKDEDDDLNRKIVEIENNVPDEIDVEIPMIYVYKAGLTKDEMEDLQEYIDIIENNVPDKLEIPNVNVYNAMDLAPRWRMT